MRQVVASILVTSSLTLPALAFQARTGAPGGLQKIGACSLLTREMVEKVLTGNKEAFKYMQPDERPIGTHGSFCDYGVIFQLNPFLRHEEMRKSPPKEWRPVTGLGDTAFFHNNKNLFGELVVWTGAHHFTIQMTAPAGGTVESIRPNLIALANAVIPKLR